MRVQARLWIFDLTDHQPIYTTKKGGTYTEMFCRSKQIYREDVKKAAGFSSLDDTEAEAWKKLLEAFSKETES